VNVFHIVSTTAWTDARAEASLRPESLTTEGFIHFSYAGQVAATANRHYREVDGLQVVEVDPDLIGLDLVLEPSPVTGEVYPHLYGPLPVVAVIGVHPLDRGANGDYVFAPPSR
jgi:uncharacterized protein (DUF952 family)